MTIEKPQDLDILRVDKGNFYIFQGACDKLYNKIVGDKYKFCYMIYIRRGGMPVARELCGHYQTNNATGITFDSKYSPDGTRKSPKLTEGLNPEVREIIGDGSILVVDDVCDRGLTQKLARKYLMEDQEIRELRIACPYVKPWRELEPQYWAEETKKWIVFPGETNEAIVKIQDSWKIGKFDEQTARRLLNHFSEEEIREAIESKEISIKMGFYRY